MKKIPVSLIVTLLSFVVIVNAQQKSTSPDLDFNKTLQPVTAKNMFLDSTYNIWFGSVIKGKNNRYYMSYSGWLRKNGRQDWVAHSEIALAVADHVGGLFITGNTL